MYTTVAGTTTENEDRRPSITTSGHRHYYSPRDSMPDFPPLKDDLVIESVKPPTSSVTTGTPTM